MLPPIFLHLPDYLPPLPGVVPSYSRLKLRAKQLLLSDWSATPAPPYNPYPPSARPIPSLAWASFLEGSIHPMCSGKGYVAAHPSWDTPDADTSCPLCSDAPHLFEHAILSCLSYANQRSRLLQGVSELALEAPIWSDQRLLIPPAEVIRTTGTGFPPGMPPLAPSLHTPSPYTLFHSTALSAPGP